MRKCYANANMLLRKFVKCSPDVKCYLFKTYCCKLYCAPFWYDSTKAAMKNLKVAYNNSLHRLLGLPSHNSASAGCALNARPLAPGDWDFLWATESCFTGRPRGDSIL